VDFYQVYGTVSCIWSDNLSHNREMILPSLGLTVILVGTSVVIAHSRVTMIVQTTLRFWEIESVAFQDRDFRSV